MFTSVDKALVALFMAFAYIASQFGFIIPEWMTEGTMGSFFAFLSPVLVYFWPNKKA